MKNTIRTAFSALQLAGAFTLVATVAANAESATKQCSDDWKTAKAANTTIGQTWQEFLKACRERLAAPPQPVASPPSPAPSQQPGMAQTTPKLMLSPGQYLDNANGDVYQYVATPGITWQQALIRAAEKSINGFSGYLAIITSQAELEFIENNVIPGGTDTPNVYIGGRQVGPGKWAWVAGPEAGSVGTRDRSALSPPGTQFIRSQGVRLPRQTARACPTFISTPGTGLISLRLGARR